MDSNGFTASTMFYRETLTEYLTPVDGGAYRISANEDPSEAVIDVYSHGHMTLALASLTRCFRMTGSRSLIGNSGSGWYLPAPGTR